ncbi:HtaA domain-containing protein [Streptomyces sp. NBC_00091]|uniref:HtaA domain-containing protein n=1 Tax=Streptomyces sp. NBC_00091 TaxID=2975648 RepID=UPI00225B12F4|nr:HtaA domain-containing protein [Streptomyces sp. NBC_00091]MCX5378638.1 HtaA domain-containing protein [Streptomyces sp. NBC_00091]
MSSNRRPIAVAAAVLTAAALGATAFTLPAAAEGAAPAAAAAQAAAAPIPVVGGTLDWGVLASFRAYVTGMAQGKITTADGATQNADGTFRFGSATGQYDKDGGHVVKAAFKGSATFESAAHGFVIKMENFRFDTGTKKLTVDITRNGTLTKDVPAATVAFGGMNMSGLTTTLTKELAEQLSGPYEGREGDKLTAALEFQKPPSPSPSASTPTSPSPSAPTPSTPSAPTPSADGPQKILRGKLTWGVMASFHDYVGEKGITTSGGATKNGKTFDFSFGKGELDAEKQKLNAAFEGAVRFEYAAHGLDLTFGNIRIETAGKTGTLILDAKTATGTGKDIPFATLDLSKGDYKTKGGLLTLESVPAVFTEKGSAVFANGNSVPEKYKPGQPMDPVTLSVAVDKDATLPTPSATSTATGGTGTTGGTTTTGGSAGGSVGGGSVGGSAGGSAGGNLAATGSEVPAGALLGASATVVAAGAGAVYLGRRRRTVLG